MTTETKRCLGTWLMLAVVLVLLLALAHKAHAQIMPMSSFIATTNTTATYKSSTQSIGAKTLTTTTKVLTSQVVMTSTNGIRHWLDKNGCAWVVRNGVTNGPSCPPPAPTSKTLVWDSQPNRQVIYSIFTSTNKIGGWTIVANVSGSSNSWTTRLDYSKPIFFSVK